MDLRPEWTFKDIDLDTKKALQGLERAGARLRRYEETVERLRPIMEPNPNMTVAEAIKVLGYTSTAMTIMTKTEINGEIAQLEIDERRRGTFRAACDRVDQIKLDHDLQGNTHELVGVYLQACAASWDECMALGWTGVLEDDMRDGLSEEESRSDPENRAHVFDMASVVADDSGAEAVLDACGFERTPLPTQV